MSEIASSQESVVKKKQKGFLDFNKRKFSKLARDYHHELLHVTIDLRDINRRIQNSTALCKLQIQFLNQPKHSHLSPQQEPPCFNDTRYHLENFNFRVTAYRDKVMQFINQALGFGFDERVSGTHTAIIGNKITKQLSLDTVLKRFDKDPDFKGALSERILQSHRRYYHEEAGYHSLMVPSTAEKARGKTYQRLWTNNIQSKASRATRIVSKIMEINDRLMEKVNKYAESN